MLTLTRKVGESVCIGDDIKVVVKEVKGKQVRLGIIAPREVYVCQEELYERIQKANAGAAAANVNILDSISDLFSSKPKEEIMKIETFVLVLWILTIQWFLISQWDSWGLRS